MASDVADNQSNLDGVETEVAQLEMAISDNLDSITDNSSDISDNWDAISNNELAIATNGDEIALNSRISGRRVVASAANGSIS